MKKRSHPSETGPEAWAAQERLRFVERALFWRGQVKRRDLREGFGISMAQASADLQRYFELNPTAARYDLSAKCYKGLPDMECVLHAPRLEEAMAMYLGAGLSATSGWGSPPAAIEQAASRAGRVERVVLPAREASLAVKRFVFQAVLHRFRLHIDYGSLTGRRRAGWRWIVPCAFAHEGYRWHVRAWCEENEDYRDFVLSRIRKCEPPVEAPAGDLPADVDWETWEELTFQANPDLSEEQRATVEADFGMRSGQVTVRVRRAMRDYTLVHLRLPPREGQSPQPFLRLV